MALVSCPECGHKVSDKAETCPSCGYAITKKKESKKESENVSTGTGCLIIIALLFFIGWVWMPDSGSDGGGSASQSDEPSTSAAYVMCQEFVSKRLKSPGSADFPWGASQGTTKLGENKFRIQTYVDSENSFGANIRTHFDCTVEYAGNDRWKLINLTFD